MNVAAAAIAAIHKKRCADVCEIYDAIEGADPGVSTERLLQMTCDQSGRDMGFVVAALELMRGEPKP
jgi:hypothetical protein